MTRVLEQQIAGSLLEHIADSRAAIKKFGDEVATGYKATLPSETTRAATIAQFRSSLDRIAGYSSRIQAVRSFLEFQDGVVAEGNELLTRAEEIAHQAANGALGATERAQLAPEIWQIRDHMVSLVNSKYQGKYLYGGADDDDPPYDPATYTTPSTGSASQRFLFDAESGTSTTRTVNVTDDLSVVVNTSGFSIYDDAIHALERLGRALEGYATNPASGVPDGTGGAYTSFDQQTIDIRGSITLLETARATDIMPERTTVAAKLRRLETADAILERGKLSAESVLNDLQNADIAESASNLSLAQNALQASFTVTSRVLNQTVLDYL